MVQVAVLDDWQGVARTAADWSALEARAAVTFMADPFASEDAAAAALAPYDVLIPMRERTAFPASLLERLPRLKLIALTGNRSPSLDLAACARQGITVCNTGGTTSSTATAELTLGLLLAAARAIPAGDAAIRDGRFQGGVPVGPVLAGKTLGIIGLGRIGARLARYARALDMRVLAWSQNLTAEAAEAEGAERVEKETLLEAADAVSLHLVLSPRSRGIIGAAELARMKPGAILVNTSRGPLIEEAALLDALHARRIVAALDVYDREPLPADHPLRQAPNTVLTPHLGYGVRESFAQFYGESIANVLAFLDGAPTRVLQAPA